jgi:hypothetical protein
MRPSPTYDPLDVFGVFDATLLSDKNGWVFPVQLPASGADFSKRVAAEPHGLHAALTARPRAWAACGLC